MVQFLSFLILGMCVCVCVCAGACEQVMSPPVAGAFRERPSKPTTFRKFYERREFPIALSHDTKGHRIAWKVGTPPVGLQVFFFFLS